MPTARRTRSPRLSDCAGRLVLHPQQDELLLADRLALFDEDVAPGVGVVLLLRPGSGPGHAAWR